MEWIVIKISRSWIKHFKLNSKILIVIVRNASKFYALLFIFFFFLLLSLYELFRKTICSIRFRRKKMFHLTDEEATTNHNLYGTVQCSVATYIEIYASNNKRSRSAIIFLKF